jgi:hypothetical protein
VPLRGLAVTRVILDAADQRDPTRQGQDLAMLTEDQALVSEEADST